MFATRRSACSSCAGWRLSACRWASSARATCRPPRRWALGVRRGLGAAGVGRVARAVAVQVVVGRGALGALRSCRSCRR